MTCMTRMTQLCQSVAQENPDTDPEDDGGHAEGGLQTRRSSRQTKKPKTFAEEFIAEPDPESLMGMPGGSAIQGDFFGSLHRLTPKVTHRPWCMHSISHK